MGTFPRGERPHLFENMNTAILLIDFGSALEARSICAYLEDIYADPHMIGYRWPAVLRRASAYLLSMMAARRCARRAEDIRDKVSPARERDCVAEGLSHRVGLHVAWATRYAQPSIADALGRMMKDGYQHVVVVPLFAHRSFALTDSIIDACEDFKRAAKGPPIQLSYVTSWSACASFTRAWVEAIERAWPSSPDWKDAKILVAAHAVPVKHVERYGCPYPHEIEQSAERVRGLLAGSPPITIAYQSRARFGRWTGPTVHDEIQNQLIQGVRRILVVPLSFLFENTETLIDLDGAIAQSRASGGCEIVRVPAPGAAAKVIDALAEAVENVIRR